MKLNWFQGEKRLHSLIYFWHLYSRRIMNFILIIPFPWGIWSHWNSHTITSYNERIHKMQPLKKVDFIPNMDPTHQDLSHSHSLSDWTNSMGAKPMGTTCQISSITQHKGVAHLRQGTEFGRNKVFIEWKFRKWVGQLTP